MTPRSLFNTIIKVIAIYLIVSSFTLLPQWVSLLFANLEQVVHANTENNVFSTLIFLFLALGLYILILRYCFFKTDWLVDKLHLDRGFAEEKFDLSIHRSTILKIAVIVTGAVMIIDTLPILCKDTFVYFQIGEHDQGFKQNPVSKYLVYDLVKVFVGFSLMTTSRLVVNFIELKRKGSVQTEETK